MTAAVRACQALAFVLVVAWSAGSPAHGQAPVPAADPASTLPSPVAIDTLRIEGHQRLRTAEVRNILRRAVTAGPDASGSARPGSPPAAVLTPATLPLALERLGQRMVEEGHFEAEVEWTAAALRIREGPATLWDTLYVSIARADPAPSPASPEGPEVRDRDVDADPLLDVDRLRGAFVADRFEQTLWQWVRDWSDRGHPFAVATVESLLVRDGTVRAGLRCDPGPFVRIDQVRFPGRTRTRADFLASWIRFRPGRPFRTSEWESRRRRLAQSGLFVRVGDVQLTPAVDGKAMAYIPVEEGPHNRLEGVLGVAGESSSISGYASVDLGNLFGTGRRLGLRWERVQDQQTRFRLNYTEPLILGLPVGARGSLEQQVQDSTYTLDRIEVLGEALVGWDLFVSAGLEARRAVLGSEPAERITRVSTVLGSRWDFLDPVRFEGGRVEFSFRTGTSRIEPPGRPPVRQRLDRVDVGGDRFVAVGGWLARLGVRAAGLSGASTDSLAVSEALWVGGAGSLRGYREEAFATRRYALGQLEVGLALPGEGGRAYVFVDGGWLRRLAVPATTATRVGYGIGISTASPRRTVGLDFGIPRGQGFRDGRIHLKLETRF